VGSGLAVGFVTLGKFGLPILADAVLESSEPGEKTRSAPGTAIAFGSPPTIPVRLPGMKAVIRAGSGRASPRSTRTPTSTLLSDL